MGDAAFGGGRSATMKPGLELRDAALDFGYPFGGVFGFRPARQHPAEGDDPEGNSRYAEYRGSNPHEEILSHATHSETAGALAAAPRVTVLIPQRPHP